jgi:hypothetical protein
LELGEELRTPDSEIRWHERGAMLNQGGCFVVEIVLCDAKIIDKNNYKNDFSRIDDFLV